MAQPLNKARLTTKKYKYPTDSKHAGVMRRTVEAATFLKIN